MSEDETDDGDGDEGPALPAFHSWLYAPETIGMGSYTYTYVDDRFEDSSRELPSRNVDWATETVTYVDNEQFDGIDHAVSIDYREDRTTFGLAVVDGFDPATMRSELEDAITDEDGVETETYASHDVYFDEEYAVAIGDGTPATYLVGSANADREATGRDIVEAMIDARAGTATRLHEGDETAARLLRRQDERAVVFGAPTLQGRAESLFEPSSGDGTDTPSVEAAGFSVDADESGSRYRVTVITEEPVEDPDGLAADLPVLERVDEPSVTQDGVVLTYEVERTADGTDSGDERSGPKARFEVEIDGDTAEITHTSGDSILADELEVRIETGGRTRTIPFGVLSSADEVQAGHTASVSVGDADPGSDLRIVWTPGPTVLHAETLPEETSRVPDASFEIEFDRTLDTATVQHTGGDSIPAAELDIVINRRTLNWPKLSNEQTVEAGDSVTVDLTEDDYGESIFVGWQVEGEILASWSVPRSQ
ncbi:hypothetical protein [Natrinema versiforme]|uniref:Uncharacterized protein n=1 Tax=Natrinema versiforme TaxID=88724 RepID=A0A4P8WLL1_9EURY|nr:hypothetical protein [Natrinema versiforme]QCS44012.1 hypothetical protein FEJ81_17295 [Natrinema versiforme]